MPSRESRFVGLTACRRHGRSACLHLGDLEGPAGRVTEAQFIWLITVTGAGGGCCTKGLSKIEHIDAHALEDRSGKRRIVRENAEGYVVRGNLMRTVLPRGVFSGEKSPAGLIGQTDRKFHSI